VLLLQGSSNQRRLWNNSKLSAKRHVLYGIVLVVLSFHLCVYRVTEKTYSTDSIFSLQPSKSRQVSQRAVASSRTVRQLCREYVQTGTIWPMLNSAT
jgi:hypothetical protein